MLLRHEMGVGCCNGAWHGRQRAQNLSAAATGDRAAPLHTPDRLATRFCPPYAFVTQMHTR